MPTSDKRGILAVTVITLFCVRSTTLGASSEQASLNCTVCTTASHHMMNTSRICLTGEQPVYTTVFHHRLRNSDRTLPTASPTSLKVSNDYSTMATNTTTTRTSFRHGALTYLPAPILPLPVLCSSSQNHTPFLSVCGD